MDSDRFAEPPAAHGRSKREDMTAPDTLSDEQLLARFTAGDRAALGELAARHENHLVGLATGLLDGRRDLAQDAVQEAWVRVIRYANSFAGQSSFQTWMFRIVINRCRDLRTGLKAAQRADGDPPPTGQEEGPLRLVTTDRPDDVRSALQKLVPSVRLVLLLCYHRGLTHPQAAEVLGIPVGTLKSRLSAALRELRGVLQAETVEEIKVARP